jgi:hypothetical protein
MRARARMNLSDSPLAALTRATLACGEEMDALVVKWSKYFLTTISSLNCKEEQRPRVLYEQVGSADLVALVHQIELAVAQEVRYENIQVQESVHPEVREDLFPGQTRWF